MNANKPKQRPVTYFQFPLCALAFGRDWTERLNTILAYAAIETGRAFLAKLPPQHRPARLEQAFAERPLPADFDRLNQLHTLAILGASIIGVIDFSPIHFAKCHQALARHRERFESRHGKDPLVRLRRDLLFEARDGGGINPQELSVLAAILSVIGKKKGVVRITKRTILHRALGYKTHGIMCAQLRIRDDRAQPFTDSELRKALNALTSRKFFSRRTFARRETYYALRLTDGQIDAAILERKNRAWASSLAQKLKNDDLTSKIRAARKTTQTSEKPDAH